MKLLHKPVHLSILLGLLLVLALAAVSISDAATGNGSATGISEKPARMCMVYYGMHSPNIDKRIISVRPEYLFSNTAHCLWGEMYGHDAEWLLQDVGKFKNAGIKVMGYLTSGYEGKGSSTGLDRWWYTLGMNKTLIRDMAELDRVDGVFIDECTAYPDDNSKKYLKELSSLAHYYGLIVWGNVGNSSFDPWYFTDGGFDFLNSTEEWDGQDLTPVQKEWGSRLSVTTVDSSASPFKVSRLSIDAWKKGLAYCYVTPSYLLLPSWIEESAELLRLAGKSEV